MFVNPIQVAFVSNDLIAIARPEPIIMVAISLIIKDILMYLQL
jgi:hypothetical protein